MTIDNDEAETGVTGLRDRSLARAMLSLKPWILTVAYLALSFLSIFTSPGSLAYVALGAFCVFMLGGWWWAIVRAVGHARPTPASRWPWLLVTPLVWMPVQWLAEVWLGPMDGELSSPQVVFKIVSMFVAGAFFYGFWRLASAFEQAVRGEKAKGEDVLATAFQLILFPIGVWTLNAKLRRLLSLTL